MCYHHVHHKLEFNKDCQHRICYQLHENSVVTKLIQDTSHVTKTSKSLPFANKQSRRQMLLTMEHLVIVHINSIATHIPCVLPQRYIQDEHSFCKTECIHLTYLRAHTHTFKIAEIKICLLHSWPNTQAS